MQIAKTPLLRSFRAFIVLIVSVFALLSLFALHQQASRQADSRLEALVGSQTQVAAFHLARDLERDWRDLMHLSTHVADLERDALSHLLNGASGDGSRISWLGYVGLDGVVVAATNDLLVGETVSTRPWFINGLNGSYAGDVHDAVLLAQLLEPDGTEPLRFIDFAVPVYDQDQNTIGVLGLHINAAWLNAYLEQSAESFGMDFYLINPDNSVSAASSGIRAEQDTTQILTALQPGVGAQSSAIWSEGNRYFSALVSQVAYGSMPSFGWRMLGKLDAEAAQTTGLELSSIRIVGFGFLVFLSLGLVYARIFIAPFSALAASAQKIADGSGDYPDGAQSSLEAAQISTALVSFQLRNVSDDN